MASTARTTTSTAAAVGRQFHTGPGPDQGPWAAGFHPDQRSDNELLAAHIGGDLEAFGEFTRRYFHFLVAVAARRIGWWRWDDAQDAAANTLADLLTQPEKIDPDGIRDVRSWLASFVRNQAMRIVAGYAQRRTPVREPHVIREVITAEGYRLPGTSGPAEPCTEGERASRDENTEAFAGRVAQVLARLTPLQREVMTMRRLHGMTQREIAAALDRTLSSVKHAEAAATVNLRRELAHLLESGAVAAPDGPDAVPAAASAAIMGGPASSVGAGVVAAVVAARVVEVLARLTPLEREVMTMRHLQGMTQREIAAALGRTRDSIKDAQRRARLNLRRELTDLLDTADTADTAADAAPTSQAAAANPRVAALARRLATGEELTGAAAAAALGCSTRSARRLLAQARLLTSHH